MPSYGDRQQEDGNGGWLTWWKLAAMTVGSGVILAITAVATVADPTYVLAIASVSVLLAIGFLVVELTTTAPGPRLVIREDGPQSRWRWKGNIALLLAIASIIASLGKSAAEIWNAGGDSTAPATKETAAQPPIINNTTNIYRDRPPRHRACGSAGCQGHSIDRACRRRSGFCR